jgi:hypothetical protein
MSDYTLALLNKANSVSAEPYEAYTKPRIADFTKDQKTAYDLTEKSTGAFNQPVNDAMTMAKNSVLNNASAAGAANLTAAGAINPIANATGSYDAAKAIDASGAVSGIYDKALGIDPVAAIQQDLGTARDINSSAEAKNYYDQATKRIYESNQDKDFFSFF